MKIKLDILLFITITVLSCENEDDVNEANKNLSITVLGQLENDLLQINIESFKPQEFNQINLSSELTIEDYQYYTLDQGLLSVFNLYGDAHKLYQKNILTNSEGSSIYGCDVDFDEEQYISARANSDYFVQHNVLFSQELQFLRIYDIKSQTCSLIQQSGQNIFDEIEVFGSYVATLSTQIDSRKLQVFDLNSTEKLGELQLDLGDIATIVNEAIYIFSNTKNTQRYAINSFESLGDIEFQRAGYQFNDSSRLIKVKTKNNYVELIRELAQPSQFYGIPAILDLDNGNVSISEINLFEIYNTVISETSLNLTLNLLTVNLQSQRIFLGFDAFNNDTLQDEGGVIATTNFNGEDLELVNVEISPQKIVTSN
ncbi:hypothetical protein [Gangjinia marincola]